MSKSAPSLADKFDLTVDRVLLTGAQAAVRLLLMQHERDRLAGLNTAGYATGYRGSPIAGLDGQMKRAGSQLAARNIVFQPGLNEELAADALWGAQQAELRGEGKYDGVFGLWYGKGPGVDRAGDALRHANHAGTSRHGGVVALMGDDHTCESSTTAHQSEFAFVDAMIPILSPAGVQEILDYGVYGFALSRFAGTWAGIKCVKDNMEATAVCDGRPSRVSIALPTDYAMPPGGLNILINEAPIAREARLHDFRHAAGIAFARANGLDKIIWRGGPSPRIGIVSSGKSYLDTRQALDELGIDEVRGAALGIRLYKVAMPWPLEPSGLRAFAAGLDLIIVVEEKRSLIETQMREILYGTANAPTIVGKYDEHGKWLFPSKGALEPTQIALGIGERVLRFAQDATLKERLAHLRQLVGNAAPRTDAVQRTPYFCAGCPHNSSTVVPEGSRAYAGIGCHYMAQWMDRETTGFTQMGGEGANWIGEAPFSKTGHVFQNIGDGTYVHSGSLAIRAAIASGVNITYKILFNDAVAMTGGQALDGGKTAPQIAFEMVAEGAKRVVMLTDEPEKYSGVQLPRGVDVHHRDDLDEVQKTLREIPGTTVLIFDQTCAAEKRRRRKRGTFPDPDKRVVINAAVCEGCGDCGVQSNCVAILPLETDLGRKRQIDQSACNKDFSCVKGFCPSFVTIEGAKPKKVRSGVLDGQIYVNTDKIPEPALPVLDRPYQMIINGIGGTGVVTVMAVLGEAAFLEGKAFGGMEMTGMAQKGGAVACHARIARNADDIHAIRTAIGGADLIIGGDLVVTASPGMLATIAPGRTRAVVNSHEVLTGDFTRTPAMALPARRMRRDIEERTGAARNWFLDAHDVAEKVFGDSIGANMLMLGYAYQLGLVPVGAAAIEQAIELNGAAVQMNRRAFRLGRTVAHDPAQLDRLLARPAATPAAETVEALIARRATFLTQYQDARYADRYRAGLLAIRSAEQRVQPGNDALTRTAAETLFKMMAYKDEYEVARLYTDGAFAATLQEQFDGVGKITLYLAPPLLPGTDKATGRPKKRAFGPWILPVLRQLAKLKRLRGTAWDVFGRSAERRLERQLIADYEALLAKVADEVGADNCAEAVTLLAAAGTIKGFGPVKQASTQVAQQRQAQDLVVFRSAGGAQNRP
jgi:indolepyruvate ferredoxin oxidoreductase